MKALIGMLLVAPVWACVTCHSDQAAAFEKDVHRSHGFSCADCHGGDPKSEDMAVAMNRAKGFVGKPARTAVPKLCARCHSDATLMHRYAPQQRVDQLAQYQTSVHGKRLAAGDTNVANCADCHGAHGIRTVRDALSPVHPLHLPETCARCHADPKHMAPYKLPTNQFEQYRKSVHWEAVAKRGDLSAPTCASCHGNHGATPPNAASVAAVCGTCHVLFEQLYAKSPHAGVMDGCVTCHSNHEIHRPSVAMLGTVCSQCHEGDSAGGRTAARMAAMLKDLQGQLDRSDEILNRARRSGMEVSEAQIQLLEGRENMVKARVAVHAFQLAAVQKPVADGLTIARQTYGAGEGALKERDQRRIGLALSLVFILITMAGLWMAIRAIEARNGAGKRSAGR